jgi:hypothetical protein
MIFSEKCLFVKRKPQLDRYIGIGLCSEDYSTFTVLIHGKADMPEKFVTGRTRDAMYSALTLFFWFVKEKLNFFLEGADLREFPISMHEVFSLEK